MIFARPVQMTDALKHATARRVLPLAFSSAEIAQHLPAQIRQRSIISARNIYTSQLAESAALIGRMVQPDVILQADGTLRRAEKGEALGHVKVRSLMRRHLESVGYQAKEGEEGTLTDLASNQRINLVINTQMQMCRQYGRERTRQASAILQAFPADKLYRAMTRKDERDWQARWNSAKVSTPGTKATVATSSAGPFIAPANDPIWVAISRFGNPFPPFDYMSGMRKRGVLASEAARHGITDTPRPAADPLVQATSVSLPTNMPPPMLDAVARAFGNLARITDGRMHITPPPALSIAHVLDASARGVQARAPIGFVGVQTRGQIAKAIGNELPGEARWVIESDQVKHAMTGHPEITEDVVKRLPDMLDAPAGVTISTKKAATRQGEKTLQVRCKDAATGQHYEVVADVVRKQTELRIYTLYKVKP